MDYSTIHDLLHNLDEAEVLAACAFSDPEFASRYPDMLRQLKEVKPKRTTMTVVIKSVGDEDNHYYDVSGKEFGDPEYYAIEFMTWGEWLGSSFTVEGTDLTPVQILAECLNEMSWAGWTPADIAEQRDTIIERYEEFRDFLDNENDAG